MLTPPGERTPDIFRQLSQPAANQLPLCPAVPLRRHRHQARPDHQLPQLSLFLQRPDQGKHQHRRRGAHDVLPSGRIVRMTPQGHPVLPEHRADHRGLTASWVCRRIRSMALTARTSAPAAEPG